MLFKNYRKFRLQRILNKSGKQINTSYMENPLQHLTLLQKRWFIPQEVTMLDWWKVSCSDFTHHKKVLDFIHNGVLGNIFSFYGRYGFQAIPKNDIRYKKELGGGILNDATCYPIC